MPGKSRRGRSKHSSQSKKKGSLARAARQQPISQTGKPVSRPGVSAPSASVSTPIAALSAARNPHIITELRTIGILAGVILVILVVLALVLS